MLRCRTEITKKKNNNPDETYLFNGNSANFKKRGGEGGTGPRNIRLLGRPLFKETPPPKRRPLHYDHFESGINGCWPVWEGLRSQRETDPKYA